MSTPNIIAIIDDHYALREALADLLRSEGYATEAYASGEELLDRTAAADVGCVVSDIRMQGMLGIDM